MSFRLKLLGVLLGGGLAFYGFKEHTLAAAASETPQRLTCAQLGERGCGNNAHVVLTDFLFASDFVYSEKSGKWKQIWIPAVPIDGEYATKVLAAGKDAAKVPAPRPVLVIVTSEKVPDESALAGLADRRDLQGLVTNVIEKIDGKTKKLLEEAYGDVSRAQIFEVGRTVKGSAMTLGWIIAGCVLALASAAAFFLKQKPKEVAA